MVWACKFLVVASLLWSVISALSMYPHQLAYFNESAGGPENGHKHLLGSNLDWGQDYLILREWIVQRNLRNEVIVVPTKYCSYESLLDQEKSKNSISQHWEAVSVNRVFAEGGEWLTGQRRSLRLRVGFSTWIFKRNP